MVGSEECILWEGDWSDTYMAVRQEQCWEWQWTVKAETCREWLGLK